MNADDRLQRRDVFLGNAADYAAVRPEYPHEVLADAVALAGLTTGASILEIGCGTGQATHWFARQGFNILALDRSPAMVREAQDRVRGFGNVDVRCQDFETFTPALSYDAVVAATSYHWLDRATRANRCAAHLGSGASLILLWHSHPLPYTGFFARVQSVYERLVPEWSPTAQSQSDRERRIVEEIRECALFESVEHRETHWSRTYSRAHYERLLATYSDHVALGLRRFSELVQSIGELIDHEFEGAIERPYLTEMVVARRNDREALAFAH